ncbi:MAG: Biotin transporter BioY [Candidatus Anoxychlamydiales bacterium]|nr:Biotin transporter BioY [Candidatus Anoxychlamydiales bacterium]
MIKAIAKRIEIEAFKDVCLVILAAFFIGMFAKIYIPLFFTPVPLILQNSIAITYGSFLGSKKGSISVLLFILLGIFGLPFFSNGDFGMQTILSVRGGYILSYALACFIVGKLLEKREDSSQKYIGFTVLLGHLTVLFGGFLWFSFFVGLKKAFLLGVVPFIATDVLKSIVITKLITFKNKYF